LRKTVLYSLAALTIILVLGATISPTMAANYNQVSVKVGDTGTYRVSFTSSTDNKSTVLVWGIVGSLVYLNYTNYAPSGAVHTKGQYIVDVYAGSFLTYLYLTAGNLTKNDGLYHGSTGLWINDTTSMIIAGVNRTVNHFRISNGLQEAWWDKETGLMVKANIWFFGWGNYTMISSTAWSAPAPPPSLFSNPMTLVAIGEGVLIIVLIALMALRGRGKKR
jgi:hypothetical protein